MFAKSFKVFLVICGLIAFCGAKTLSTNTEECPQICPDNYAPLCATNGIMFKEFSNNCDFKANNCRLERSDQQKYVTTAMEWCSTELVQNLDRLLEKLGNVDLETPDCLKACPLIYQPVCISNGKYRVVVSNKCVMESFNCALAKNGTAAFRVLKHDSC